MKTEDQQDATIRCLLLTSASTCFGHHYAHLQENKERVTVFRVLFWFCWMWLVAVVWRCLVRCEQCDNWTHGSVTYGRLKVLPWWLWWLVSSGMWRCVDVGTTTDAARPTPKSRHVSYFSIRRWRQIFPPKPWHSLFKLYGVTSHKNSFFVWQEVQIRIVKCHAFVSSAVCWKSVFALFKAFLYDFL